MTARSIAAFQGEPGAYSELAAGRLLGETTALHPCTVLSDVGTAVLDGRATHGVVPLENTIAGTVPGAYELLLAHDLRVIAETRIAIDHVLIGLPGASLAGVRRVLSHPVALDQCRQFLSARPHLVPVPVFDTAGAVRMVLQDGDPASAAIAGRHAAATHGGVVLAEDIQDQPENWTRFGLLVRADKDQRSDAITRAAIAFGLPHEPGSLASALQILARARVNLTKIESRPIPTHPFEYLFVVELDCAETNHLRRAMRGLARRTTFLRVLGTYATTATGETV